mmetsp:Transcript_21430/g.42906  ORF Transcript_21430/g.42906 Transcript_21430/m.42906 type:complete len:223 (+) Transcript_21430:548-1216(+)
MTAGISAGPGWWPRRAASSRNGRRPRGRRWPTTRNFCARRPYPASSPKNSTQRRSPCTEIRTQDTKTRHPRPASSSSGRWCSPSGTWGRAQERAPEPRGRRNKRVKNSTSSWSPCSRDPTRNSTTTWDTSGTRRRARRPPTTGSCTTSKRCGCRKETQQRGSSTRRLSCIRAEKAAGGASLQREESCRRAAMTLTAGANGRAWSSTCRRCTGPTPAMDIASS